MLRSSTASNDFPLISSNALVQDLECLASQRLFVVIVGREEAVRRSRLLTVLHLYLNCEYND